MSIKALQNYTYYSRYAGYNEQEKRRETWAEAVDRMMDMHLRRYPQVADEIEKVRDLIKEKRFVGSQRALQFAGSPIEKKHSRLYNCSFSYVDRIRFFQEAFWLLLCGSGVGYSVQKHHVAKLPEFTTKDRGPATYIVPDTIEGWADSLGILLASYFPHPDFSDWEGKKVTFDFSLIRPAGSKLGSGIGKAPGPEPLRLALERIDVLLKRCQKQGKLRSIDAHDIILHASDAVLSGGVRRSSCLAMFSIDDNEMTRCKTGNWQYENPQRARANNSVVLLRNEVSEKQFLELMENIKEYGEPGFFWVDSLEVGFNPCSEISFYAYDENGNSGFQMCNLSEINGKKVKSKEDFAIAAEGAAIIGTLQAGYTDFSYLGKVSEDIIRRESLIGVSITGMMDNPDVLFDPEIQREMAELVKKTNRRIASLIGINPAARTCCLKPSGCRPVNAITTTENGILTLGELLENHDIRETWQNTNSTVVTAGGPITKTFINGNKEVVKVNLKYGIELVCTPNHPWFVKYRIDRKKKTKKIEVNNWVEAQDLQFGDVLDVNLSAYRKTTHAPLKKEYRLKAYSKFLYNYNDIKQPDLLNNDLSWLLGYLWGDGSMKFNKYRLNFSDSYREHLEKAQRIVKEQFNIDSKISKYNNKNAYSLEFGNKFLWYWLVNNDIYKYDGNEINYIPRLVRESSYDDIISFIAGMLDSDGHVRYQIVKGGEKRYAAIFSTANDRFADHFQQVAISVGLGFSKSLQAHLLGGENYQNKKHIWLLNLSSHVDSDSFNKLADNSEKIKNITTLYPGYFWMHEIHSPNTGIFGKVHSVEPFGVQPTFDIETENHWFYAGAIKSHNTTSCILGTASGIHPHHAKRYLRRVQGNVLEPVLQYFKKFNPNAVEKSVWSANGTDEIITFLVEVPPGAKVKNQLSAIELLEYVKLTQQNWVAYGKNKELCTQEWLRHNISNTITVRPNEWDEVGKYIYKNRKIFSGVTLLSTSGDLDYPQAPMVTIHDCKELIQEYGQGALFASGLIVDGLHVFDNDLWKACDNVLGKGNINPNEDQKDWIRRVEQFANRYCGGDVRRTCYLMKEVNNYKVYIDLSREYKDVPYEELREEENNTSRMEELACAGGSCELSFGKH